jgi:putative FmdB family regulatory protein
MPTYEYLCQQCGQRLEVFQKFSAKPLRVHDVCGGALQKVFHASGVVFKGSGYYVTDSRSNGPASASKSETASNGSSKKDEKQSDSRKTEKKKAESKPASDAAAAAG